MDQPDARAVAITEGLRELYPEFRDALGTLGEENFDGAITALGKLQEHFRGGTGDMSILPYHLRIARRSAHGSR